MAAGLPERRARVAAAAVGRMKDGEPPAEAARATFCGEGAAIFACGDGLLRIFDRAWFRGAVGGARAFEKKAAGRGAKMEHNPTLLWSVLADGRGSSGVLRAPDASYDAHLVVSNEYFIPHTARPSLCTCAVWALQHISSRATAAAAVPRGRDTHSTVNGTHHTLVCALSLKLLLSKEIHAPCCAVLRPRGARDHTQRTRREGVSARVRAEREKNERCCGSCGRLRRAPRRRRRAPPPLIPAPVAQPCSSGAPPPPPQSDDLVTPLASTCEALTSPSPSPTPRGEP
jgi:hypothetical protein